MRGSYNPRIQIFGTQIFMIMYHNLYFTEGETETQRGMSPCWPLSLCLKIPRVLGTVSQWVTEGGVPWGRKGNIVVISSGENHSCAKRGPNTDWTFLY